MGSYAVGVGFRLAEIAVRATRNIVIGVGMQWSDGEALDLERIMEFGGMLTASPVLGDVMPEGAARTGSPLGDVMAWDATILRIVIESLCSSLIAKCDGFLRVVPRWGRAAQRSRGKIVEWPLSGANLLKLLPNP